MQCNVKPVPVVILFILVSTIAATIPVKSKAVDSLSAHIFNTGETLTLRTKLDLIRSSETRL